MESSNRDRDKCGDCMYNNYLLCPYVKLDGCCTVTGRKVAIDYTYNHGFTDATIHK